ncbi:hypothetical protein [Paracoccus sp. TOH]|uniref:hypothetical protein n=1 Tax=Paracoccus sp. TOH TaxID=1263728 RepID=UPI0025B0ACAF|nr:hypothetical protein [Paracoccus sp. TOH]WJS87173.1 hypothetical protein NBE95_21355 [Paracoccus sp. TOH]
MTARHSDQGFELPKEFTSACYRLGYGTMHYLLGFWALLIFGGSLVGFAAVLLDVGSAELGDGVYSSFGLAGESAFGAMNAALDSFYAQHRLLVILSLMSGAALAWTVHRYGPVSQLIASLGTICLHVMILGALL